MYVTLGMCVLYYAYVEELAHKYWKQLLKNKLPLKLPLKCCNNVHTYLNWITYRHVNIRSTCRNRNRWAINLNKMMDVFLMIISNLKNQQNHSIIYATFALTIRWLNQHTSFELAYLIWSPANFYTTHPSYCCGISVSG